MKTITFNNVSLWFHLCIQIWQSHPLQHARLERNKRRQKEESWSEIVPPLHQGSIEDKLRIYLFLLSSSLLLP